MKSTLVETERQKYEDAWTIDLYAQHSPGEMFLPIFLNMIGPVPRTSVLDAGCGSGKGMLALRQAGFQSIQGCDLTDSGLVSDAKIFPFTQVWLGDKLQFDVDWVYCCDVLEHIPTAFTMLVITRLLETARRGLFLSISLVPDTMGLWVGKPLHETVQPFVWWRDNLETIGRLKAGRDFLTSAAFLLEARS